MLSWTIGVQPKSQLLPRAGRKAEGPGAMHAEMLEDGTAAATGRLSVHALVSSRPETFQGQINSIPMR